MPNKPASGLSAVGNGEARQRGAQMPQGRSDAEGGATGLASSIRFAHSEMSLYEKV